MIYEIGAYDSGITYTEKVRTACILISALVSMLIAQLSKVIYHSIKEKKFAWKFFFSTGGMPSSHTSTMVALVTTLGILQLHYESGVGYVFAVALAVTVVVVYDAMGVRYEAGRHARLLNNMLEHEPENVQKEVGYDPKNGLKEYLGHKPKEVICGLFLGLFVGILSAIIYIVFIRM